VSGVSGCGVVAEGVVFSTGRACLVWVTEFKSVGVYDYLADVLAIHGHDGKTRVVWLDPI